MFNDSERMRFQIATARGHSGPGVAILAEQLRAGDGASGAALASALAHAAFVAPDRTADICDEAATGWFGRPVKGPAIAPTTKGPWIEPLPQAFWDAFWALVGDTGTGMGAAVVTTRTAALGGCLPSDFATRLAPACAAYPGVIAAAANGLPGRFRLEDLAACPAGSLGHAFYRLIVDNDFDLEVLDRDALQLSTLPAPLNYLNTRILQVHDLWHLVAGYRTTGLHEVAISGFQLGQFGHGYSAMFLAMVAASTALRDSPAAPILWETILGSWVHGRETPALIGLPWETLWTLPVDDIRAKLGVTPYVSPYPADLFEQAMAA